MEPGAGGAVGIRHGRHLHRFVRLPGAFPDQHGAYRACSGLCGEGGEEREYLMCGYERNVQMCRCANVQMKCSECTHFAPSSAHSQICTLINTLLNNETLLTRLL